VSDGDDERYRRAQAIAHDVLAVPLAERAARIAHACDGDYALLREIEWLIAATESETTDPTPLERSVDLAHAALAEIRVDASAPHAYRLLVRLGEGGMGQVWLAERSDNAASPRVALKLLHGLAPHTLAARVRFAAEARILGSLDHPNIARLVDTGHGADGEPFIALEYVDGEPIDRWCNSRALPLRARIALFLKVCHAVEYAHGRLVIHRDLKPANIFVTGDGEPKLLDFGIARLVDTEVHGDQATTVLRAMTMAYASPEQIEGTALGIATDVYSLGVVLYELVCGARPFSGNSGHALSTAIVSGAVDPPSRRVAATATPGLTRRVPSDIDAIVLKAMRREPSQRYAAVADLVTDLRDFLASRPVSARRGQRWYRARRFLWRNRWATSAAALIVAVVAVSIVEREKQLHRIELERNRAEAITRFTTAMFDDAGALRTRGSAVTVHEMLDRGASEVESRTELPDDIRAALLLTMGRAYNSLNLGKQALPLLQSAQALNVMTGRNNQAATIEAIGLARQLQGFHPQAIADYEQAIALRRAAPDEQNAAIDSLRIRIAGLHADLVDVPIQRSIAELQNIVSRLRRTPHDSAALLAAAHGNLARAYTISGDSVRALQNAEHAAELTTQLYGDDDMRSARSRADLALAAMESDPARAAALFDALQIDYDRFSTKPTMSRVGHRYNLGKSLRLSGQLPRAATVLEDAATAATELGGPQHRLRLAVLDELAVVYNLSRMPERTLALFNRTLQDFAAAAAIGTDGERDCHAMALAALGEAQRQLGRYDEAAAHFAQADEILGRLDADGFREDILDMLDWTTRLQLDRGDPVAARATYARYEAVLRKQTPVAPRRAAAARELLAHLGPPASGAATP
jgi:eukaryotic-like serine/threonine-protein kinase